MAFPQIEGFVVTEKLGSGSYSTVYKAYTKVGAKTVVAIKCVDKSRVKNSGTAVDNLINEIRLLKTLRHPHIVHMRDFTWDTRNIYIITEYCCGGDLSRYIHRYGRVPEKQVLYFLQQLASALKFLREKGVVHMDLKPHNLLLHKGSDGKYVLKVADFGFAQYLPAEGEAGGARGSPLYMAPEMLTPQAQYDARVDLWSVGVIMYECLFGKAPYSSNTFKELVDKIQNRHPIQLPPHSRVSEGCRDLLLGLLRHEPSQRLSYERFFSHPYLDLECMPSRENYERAAALARRAVGADAAGRREAALRLYAEALRLLVPAARWEPRPRERAALQAKLVSYMERAEELKQSLKSGTNPDLTSALAMDNSSQQLRSKPSSTIGVCCMNSNAVSSNSFHFGGSNGENYPSSVQTSKHTHNHQAADQTPSNSDKGGVLSDLRRRLFGKKGGEDEPSLQVEPEECISEEREQDTTHGSRQAFGETNNEMCRIT